MHSLKPLIYKEAYRYEVREALAGNLCRCTGYEPIVKAARAAAKAGGQAMDALAVERDAATAKLAAIPAGADVSRGGDRAILPADTDGFAQALLDNPDATIIAGATDVGLWVTKFLRPIAPTPILRPADSRSDA